MGTMTKGEFDAKRTEFEGRFVKTPAVKEALQGFEWLLDYGATRGGGRFMLLTGDSRSGKSHVARAFRDRYQSEHIDGRTIAPVIYLELQAKTTESGTPSQILRALGHPAPSKGTIEDKHHQILKTIRDLGVKMLIVDEAHHLVERKPGQQNRLYAATEWLKFIMNNTGCSMVLCGIPVLNAIVDVNPQLAQRTVRWVHLPTYDRAQNSQRREYAKIVRQLCRLAPMDVDPDLLDERGIDRFHDATRGLIGNLWDLLYWASVTAHEEQYDAITLKVLAKTYPHCGVSEWTGHNFFLSR